MHWLSSIFHHCIDVKDFQSEINSNSKPRISSVSPGVTIVLHIFFMEIMNRIDIQYFAPDKNLGQISGTETLETE